MPDNLRRALFGNSRRRSSATEVIVGAVLDQANKPNSPLPLDPTLPVELQGIIKRSDYRIDEDGCWIWEKRSGMVKDPYGDRPDREEAIEDIVYRRFSGEKLPRGAEVIARCGQFYNGGVFDVSKGPDVERCINPDHLLVVNKQENDAIKKIRYRKTEEITPDQRQTITALGKRRGWTAVEQCLIFNVLHLEYLQDDQAPINRGLAKAEQGDYDGALADCDEAIEQNPNDADAYLLRGLVKTDLEDYRGAVTDLNQAVGLDRNVVTTNLPRNPRAYVALRSGLLLGLVGIATKDFAGAISNLNTAIERDPDYARAYEIRAVAKFGLGDLAGAATDVERSRDLAPETRTLTEEDATIPEPDPNDPDIIDLEIPPEPDRPLPEHPTPPEPETPPERLTPPAPQTPPETETPPAPEPETPQRQSAPAARKSKTTAALLAFLLGGFGAHKFYLGYTGAGLVHLGLSLTVIGALVNVPVCVVEFLIYLSKSDEEFHQTYVVNRKRFF